MTSQNIMIGEDSLPYRSVNQCRKEWWCFMRGSMPGRFLRRIDFPGKSKKTARLSKSAVPNRLGVNISQCQLR